MEHVIFILACLTILEGFSRFLRTLGKEKIYKKTDKRDR